MNVRAFNKIHYDIIILGGGIAGCAAAKKLSTKYKVAILEKRAHVLQGTSRKTPGRMGLGFHYFDPNTSKACLERTTKFVLQNTMFLTYCEIINIRGTLIFVYCVG